MRAALKRWNARPTRGDAEKALTRPGDDLDSCARKVEELLAPVWEEEYDWAGLWMEATGHPPEKAGAGMHASCARM